MNGETENLGIWRIAERKRFAIGALLLLAAGALGIVATAIRWAPCGDASDQGQCASFEAISQLPLLHYFLLWGIADLILAASLVFLLWGTRPKIVSILIIGCFAAMGLFSVLFGAGLESLGPVMVNALMVGSWLLIPVLSLVVIIRNVGGRGGGGHGWVALVMGSMAVGSGTTEYLVINTFVNYVDTPIGSDGLRYALFALVGAALLVFLAKQRVPAIAVASK